MAPPRRPEYWEDDETWEAYERALAMEPPAPTVLLSPLQEAIRKASGKHPTGDEIAAMIGFLNRASARLRGVPKRA